MKHEKAKKLVLYIVDETSDISHIEQVSVCLRFLIDGVTKEVFVGFYNTKCTEGLALFELIKKVLAKLKLEIVNIVGQCYDGASNMSGVHKGLAIRVKGDSPKAVYVHCHAHRLNLALQAALAENEALRNTLGTVQSIYTFLEASPKRHALFGEVRADSEPKLTLKSQSETRWSCRYESVNAVIQQLESITKALLELKDYKDSKTSSNAKSILIAICDFEFVLCLVILKIILSNVNALCRYLQSSTMDVMSARKTAEGTVKALQGCRNDQSFDTVWQMVEIKSNTLKNVIKDTKFSFKETTLPRFCQPSIRLQAPVGELCEGHTHHTTAISHHQVNIYFVALDLVIAEIKERFAADDQDIICDLGGVVLSGKPSEESEEKVAKFYELDKDLIQAEKAIFSNFLLQSASETRRTPTALAKIMSLNKLDVILLKFFRLCKILAVIPATSCSAERSFSCLRRLKTYTRNTMGQNRLNCLAVLNVERAFTNRLMRNVDKIIDIFGQRKNRKSFFF